MEMKAALVVVTGPLAVHAEAFEEDLRARGYTALSAANQLRLMAHASRWLGAQGVGAEGLTAEGVELFLAHRRSEGRTCWLSPRGMAPLMGFLRERGAVPAAVTAVGPPSAVELLLGDYAGYLARERGLAASTIGARLEVARVFVGSCCLSAEGGPAVDGLSGAVVVGFVTDRCAGRSAGWAKNLVVGLRSFLRFLHVRGDVALPLWSSVPAVAGWRGGALPRSVAAADVGRMLASCDRRRAVGRRDFAILMLLARLGLRAGEVAALELGDIDWRAGEVVIRGKGRRRELLPLPQDVGEAVAGYLRRGRAGGGGPRVFMRVRAPRGPLGAGAVTAVVRAACGRAGLPLIGAHRLRHTVATEMLRAGAPLSEVGQVLRHRSASSTAIYAKVDRAALRALALPWPGGAA